MLQQLVENRPSRVVPDRSGSVVLFFICQCTEASHNKVDVFLLAAQASWWGILCVYRGVFRACLGHCLAFSGGLVRAGRVGRARCVQDEKLTFAGPAFETWWSHYEVKVKKKRNGNKRRFGGGVKYCLATACPASAAPRAGSRPSIFSASGAFRLPHLCVRGIGLKHPSILPFWLPCFQTFFVFKTPTTQRNPSLDQVHSLSPFPLSLLLLHGYIIAPHSTPLAPTARIPLVCLIESPGSACYHNPPWLPTFFFIWHQLGLYPSLPKARSPSHAPSKRILQLAKRPQLVRNLHRLECFEENPLRPCQTCWSDVLAPVA